MKAKEFTIVENKKDRKAKKYNIKPRNPMGTAPQTGAGAHKDKKKAMKQGDVKHKGKVDEGSLEFNTPDPVVVIQDKSGKMLDKINLSLAAQKYKLGQPDVIKKQLAHQNYTTIGDYVVVSPMSGQPQDATTQSTAEAGYWYGGASHKPGWSGSSRRRDPEDWDEGNTEPPNNFAVYINGKKWKVFQGNGTYADDAREMAQYRKLQDWARKKSEATGKKWEVSRTGEKATI